MKFNIHAFHLELDDEIRDYAAEKIGSLEKYYKNIIMADVNLQCEAGDTKNVRYIAKAQISIPGEDLFAEEKAQDIFAAIDMVQEDLERQIKKRKEKENPRRIQKIQNVFKSFFGKE